MAIFKIKGIDKSGKIYLYEPRDIDYLMRLLRIASTISLEYPYKGKNRTRMFSREKLLKCLEDEELELICDETET